MTDGSWFSGLLALVFFEVHMNKLRMIIATLLYLVTGFMGAFLWLFNPNGGCYILGAISAVSLVYIFISVNNMAKEIEVDVSI